MSNRAEYSKNLIFLSENNIKKHVLPQYNLQNSQVEQIKLKDTDKQRAVYKVTSNDNTYCLKKVYYSIEELLFVYSAIEWLYHHDINVPRILSTKNHGRYVIYENMLFILTPWIQGDKCDFNSPYEIILCANTLGKLHGFSKNFKPILGSCEKCGFSNLNKTLNKHFYNLLIYSNLAYKYKDTFSKLYLEDFKINISLAKISNSISYSIKDTNLSKSLCHNDYVSKNLILDKNNNIWVIDFDKCRIDYCAFDISYCLRRMLRKEKIKWSLPLAITFLDEYEKYNILTLDDYKYILSYLSFPQKYWKISRDYYSNISKCNKKAFVSIFKKSSLYNKEQLNFVREFQRYIEYKFSVKL